MFSSLPLILGAIAFASASPVEVRTVAALDQAAFAEAQQRDDTATRAFSSTAIKVYFLPRFQSSKLTDRLLMDNVSSSMNCLEISERT
jgi:hypothetical protein